MSEKKKRPPNHYVNNRDLHSVLREYKRRDAAAVSSGSKRPLVPDYVGVCIYDIANRLASKSNFSNYSFVDEMISDGIENAVAAVRSYDPEKSDNPFGYLTITVYYAFIRRIQREKKNLYTKYKIAEKMLPDVEFMMHGSDESAPLLDILTNPYMVSLVEKMEAKMSEEEKDREKSKNNVWKRKNAS